MDAKKKTRRTEGGKPGQKSVTVNQYNTTTRAKNQALNKPLEAVTAYQEKGIHTFPLSRDKLPVVKEWNDKDFTPEQHQVNGFHGLGTCPGRWADNVMVFDIDGPQGRESWGKCLLQYGPLPETYTVTTGRVDGGSHLYYKLPDGLYVKSTASKFAKKVDIRGTRGQAVLPPTIHRSGKAYQWHFTGEPCEIPDPAEIPLLPEAWTKALIEAENAYFPGLRPPTPPPRPYTGNAGAYAAKALEAEISLVMAAPDDTRNDTLNRAAFSLGQLVAGGELDHGTVESELMAAAAAAGLDAKEIPKTIRSGINAGAKSPRRAPEPTSYTGIQTGQATIDPSKTAARAEQILKDRAAPAQFNTAHLPDDFRGYVGEICERTNTDPITIVMAVLVSLSALVGIRAFIPEGVYFSRLFAVIWVLIQDQSGAFKTTGLNKGSRMLWQRVGEIQDSIKAWEKEKLSYGFTPTKEEKQIIDELDKKIKQARYSSPLMPNKASAEGLLELMANEQRGAILCSEFGEWLANMSKTHNAGLKALFTELFDVPQQYSYMTRGGGHMIIQRPYVSIMGLSTPAWVHENINLGDVGSGFFARDLLYAPPEKRVVPPALPKYTTPIDDSFEQKIKFNLTTIDDRAFDLTPEAREAFEQIHQGIYEALSKQCTKEEQALLDPYAKRWSPYVLKLAMLFQIMEDPARDIGIEAIIPAAALVDYAMESTIYLFRGDLGLSSFQRNCEAVLKYVAKRGGSVTRKVLLSSRILGGGAKEYDEVLTMLEEAGKINIQLPAKGTKRDEKISVA